MHHTIFLLAVKKFSDKQLAFLFLGEGREKSMYFLNYEIPFICNINFNSTNFYSIFNKEKCDNSIYTSKYMLYPNLMSPFSILIVLFNLHQSPIAFTFPLSLSFSPFLFFPLSVSLSPYPLLLQQFPLQFGSELVFSSACCLGQKGDVCALDHEVIHKGSKDIP